jgi:hypothetical protein
MKRIIALISTILVFQIQAFPQTITISNVSTGLPCHYISVPITVASFPSNIGSIYLVIAINNNAVQLVNKTYGTLPTAGYIYQDNSQIILSWNNTTGISINGVLATLLLHYDGGTTVLDFNDPYCEIYVETDLLNPIPMTLVNGTVTEGSNTFHTYYVDAARPSSGDGLSWSTAFKTITEAANIPPKAGEQVQIKPGTYAEKVIIKSDGGYAVLPQTGVVLSDTNKISFPSGANLACVNLSLYPDQYYAYVYRSWASNNGYYKITEVNDALNYVRVSGASFIPESGVAGHKGKVMAAIGRPVIYKKDPTALESQRVIVNAAGLTGVDAFYVGKASGDGQTIADSCNWNIIEGIDVTGGNAGGMKGVHIQCSSYNTYANGKVYSSSGVGGLGVIISGSANSTTNGYISNRNAKFNIIQNNEIYNTPYQGILLGYTAVNNSYIYTTSNVVVNNNLYLSGSGTLARFTNAVKVQYGNKNNVIEGNNIHDFSLYTIGNGALLVESKADSTLIYNNIFKNINKVNVGTHACIMINDSTNKIFAYGNIIYNDDTVTNAVYAFRIDGKKHSGSKCAFNTIYKIDNGFYLEDNGVPTLDFAIQDNIISPTLTNFTNSGTSGRFTVTYNTFRNAPGTPYESGTGNVVGNPLFIQPDGPSMYGMMLQPTSPAIHTGTALTGLSRDYIGDLRSATPTRGAFENTMTSTWTGTTSTNWGTYTNWNYNIVPQTYTPVVIPNVTNDPVISSANVNCKSVSLSSGALLRIQSPRTLTISN